MNQSSSLSSIAQTLQEPLCSRYKEIKRYPFLFHDPKMEEIGNAFGCNAQEILPSIRYFVTIRTLCFDKQVQKFIEANPECVIANLGCGMDTRFFRMNKSQVTWYDIDLPEVIQIKQKFIHASSSYVFIRKSILDFSWMEEIKKGKQTLFIAETVLMYFPEKEVEQLFLALQAKFPAAEFLFDIVSPFVVKHSTLNPQLKRTGISFSWGIESSHTIERWGKGSTLLREWKMRDILQVYSLRSLFYALFVYIAGNNNKIRIAHLQLN